MQKQEEEKPIAESFEAELASIKEKGKDLKGTERDFYTSIVQRLENNDQVLQDLRKEHTQLRAELARLSKEKRSRTRDPNLAQDIKRTTHSVNLLKKQIDKFRHQKQEAINRQTELNVQYQNLTGGEGPKDTTSERLASLKNKLDNAEIKNQETIHLMKVYDAIVYQLQRQKMHWNRLIEEQKKEIEQKKRDLSELELIARDSVHSKNAAEMEYSRLQAKYAANRERRNQQIQAKTAQVQQHMHVPISDDSSNDSRPKANQSLNSQPSAVRNRNNRAQREKKDEKFRSVSAKYDEIREYFGTNDPDEIKKFFDDRKKNAETLRKQIEDLKASNAELEKQVAQRKSAIDEAEYTSHKGVGGNRLLNEAKKMLIKSKETLAESQKEMFAHQEFKDKVEGAIYHLTDEMLLVQKEPLKASSPTECLDWICQTVSKLKTSLEDEDFDFMTICNAQVVAQKIQAENNFDIRETESSKRQPKTRPGEILRGRQQKVDKGEFVSRVMDRNAIKALAQRTAQAKAEAAAKNRKQQY